MESYAASNTFLCLGFGKSLKIIFVIIPSVPSLPMMS